MYLPKTTEEWLFGILRIFLLGSIDGKHSKKVIRAAPDLSFITTIFFFNFLLKFLAEYCIVWIKERIDTIDISREI